MPQLSIAAKKTLAAALLSLLNHACDPFPRDPEDTLNRACDRQTLHVGYTTNEPWVSHAPTMAEPSGYEARLIKGFAAEMGLDIEWTGGPEQELFRALEDHELDLAIGGFTTKSPWQGRVAFTIPFYTDIIVIGVPPSGNRPAELDQIEVEIDRSNAIESELKRLGARPVKVNQIGKTHRLVAAEEWRVKRLGFTPTDIKLRTDRRTIALPLGENALLMRLEKFLLQNTSKEQVEKALRELED